jgi:hypothetical protein
VTPGWGILPFGVRQMENSRGNFKKSNMNYIFSVDFFSQQIPCSNCSHA